MFLGCSLSFQWDFYRGISLCVFCSWVSVELLGIAILLQEFNFGYYINSRELSLNKLAFNRGFCVLPMGFLLHCRLADAQLFISFHIAFHPSFLTS